MAALTSSRNTPEMSDFGRTQNYPLEANTTVYLGSMVALNANGNAVPAASAAGLRIVGRAERTYLGMPGQDAVNTSSATIPGTNLPAGAAGAVSVICARGIFLYAVNDGSMALTVSATAGAGKDRGWRAFSLWVTAMILLSPIGEPHYLVMLIVPFAAIADAAARGEAGPRVIYAAIAGYLVTFSRYPLALMQQYALGSAGFFRFAGQFWAVAIVLVYLAAYWLATSQKFVKHEGRAAWTPAAAQDTH
jgi:hypothetical protein